jgi:hypothetical protein
LGLTYSTRHLNSNNRLLSMAAFFWGHVFLTRCREYFWGHSYIHVPIQCAIDQCFERVFTGEWARKWKNNMAANFVAFIYCSRILAIFETEWHCIKALQYGKIDGRALVNKDVNELIAVNCFLILYMYKTHDNEMNHEWRCRQVRCDFNAIIRVGIFRSVKKQDRTEKIKNGSCWNQQM